MNKLYYLKDVYNTDKNVETIIYIHYLNSVTIKNATNSCRKAGICSSADQTQQICH